MIKAVIIDDESAGINNLKNLLNNHCKKVEVTGTANSIASGVKLLNAADTKVDVAFLDINLPDGLVFQLIEQLNNVDFEIIFVTAYDDLSLIHI